MRQAQRDTEDPCRLHARDLQFLDVLLSAASNRTKQFFTQWRWKNNFSDGHPLRPGVDMKA